MPYSLRDTCVIKSDTGDVVKCHKTKQEALDHLAALKINVSDASVSLSGSIKFEADSEDHRIIRFKDAVLARRETNANLDDIDADGISELASSLEGMPIDVEHDGRKNTGFITAARAIGDEVHIDGVIWTHRAEGYEIDPNDILNGTYQLSVEADAKSAKCSICGKTFSSDSSYCEHLQPDKKRFFGAKRFLRGLRGLGAAITKRPAGSGTAFNLNGVYLVAHLVNQQEGTEPPENILRGEINMSPEELKATLAEALNPLVARLDAVEATVKANMSSEEDEAEREEKRKAEMDAAVKDMTAKMEEKYSAEKADAEAKVTQLNEALASRQEEVLTTRAEMLKLKLVGSVMDADKFESEKDQWLSTPDAVIATIVEAAARADEDKSRGRIWLAAGTPDKPSNPKEYSFKVN